MLEVRRNMKKLWVVSAKDDKDVVYLKITKYKSTAKRWLEECQQFFENCKMEEGEFYTLDEAEEKL
jgi:inorganic pyrophosphatase